MGEHSNARPAIERLARRIVEQSEALAEQGGGRPITHQEATDRARSVAIRHDRRRDRRRS